MKTKIIKRKRPKKKMIPVLLKKWKEMAIELKVSLGLEVAIDREVKLVIGHVVDAKANKQYCCNIYKVRLLT